MAARDPILMTDIRYNIFFYNPYTPRFLDLPGDQILMHRWGEVMVIVNDQTTMDAEDPIQLIVRQMLVVTHEVNAAVVTKSRRGHRAYVIIRPVKDIQCDLIGISIHIRKKTFREKTLNQIQKVKMT
jgi:PAS domain-containing protein